jgi:HindVP restriction endonuclease
MKSENPPDQVASLFGIAKSNRDFAKSFYWGKNQFNSSFPVALACYMASRGTPLVYVKYKSASETLVEDIALSDVFRSSKPTTELYFSFESRYEPFQKYLVDELVSIDLVVCDGSKQQPICPLEIKLTTLPDSTTESLAENKYGTELVIRSATTRYMALSIAESLTKKQSIVRQLFEPVLGQVRNYDSEAEMLPKSQQIVDALCCFLDQFKSHQRPLLLQPIWKTIGKSPSLADNCLDTFVWSDFALAHLFLESARSATAGSKITRQLRSALRLSRFLY